jgi:hypothetical protein
MLVAVPAAEARVVARPMTAEQATKNFPPEMLYQGKPIDPACVEASNPTEGPTVPQELKHCTGAPEGKEIEGGLQVLRGGMIGYNYACGEGPSYGFCGFTGYKYLGKVQGGFALETLVNGGGTGQFSSVVIMKREGDKIWTDLVQPTGDRCDGGIVDSKVTDGVLEYSYNVTLGELYNSYKTTEAFQPPAGSALDCSGVIHKKDGKVTTIDFYRSKEQIDNDPACFVQAYRDQKRTSNAMTEEQMKEFFRNVENICEQELAE